MPAAPLPTPPQGWETARIIVGAMWAHLRAGFSPEQAAELGRVWERCRPARPPADVTVTTDPAVWLRGHPGTIWAAPVPAPDPHIPLQWLASRDAHAV